jgi:hypothetical protein
MMTAGLTSMTPDDSTQPIWWSPLLFLVRILEVCNTDTDNMVIMDYKKNNMSTDRENGTGNNRARVIRGSRNPKHVKRKHYIVHKPSRLN